MVPLAALCVGHGPIAAAGNKICEASAGVDPTCSAAHQSKGRKSWSREAAICPGAAATGFETFHEGNFTRPRLPNLTWSAHGVGNPILPGAGDDPRPPRIHSFPDPGGWRTLLGAGIIRRSHRCFSRPQVRLSASRNGEPGGANIDRRGNLCPNSRRPDPIG